MIASVRAGAEPNGRKSEQVVYTRLVFTFASLPLYLSVSVSLPLSLSLSLSLSRSLSLGLTLSASASDSEQVVFTHPVFTYYDTAANPTGQPAILETSSDYRCLSLSLCLSVSLPLCLSVCKLQSLL